MRIYNTVPENAMTDYSSLRILINRYNNEVAKNNPLDMIDPNIVYVRDALAHGRSTSNTIKDDLVLMKFEKPSGSTTKVVFREEITENWLKTKINLVYKEAQKVVSKIK